MEHDIIKPIQANYLLKEDIQVCWYTECKRIPKRFLVLHIYIIYIYNVVRVFVHEGRRATCGKVGTPIISNR